MPIILATQELKLERSILLALVKIVIMVYRHPYRVDEAFYPSLILVYLSLFQTKLRNLVDVSRRRVTYSVVCKELNPS